MLPPVSYTHLDVYKRQQIKGAYAEVKNKKYFTLRADAMYNLSNSVCGYNPERLFTLSVFAGPGLAFAKAYGEQDKLNALINGSVGLMGQFNAVSYTHLMSPHVSAMISECLNPQKQLKRKAFFSKPL